MSVNPGFSGQSFQLPALEKMDWLKQKIKRDNLSVTIQADGGVNSDTVAAVVANGATILVAGSAIFKSDDYHAAIQELRPSS
jgi:ribulose-phosphate 3-epimerase